MCEHKNTEKLFGLKNENGENIVLTICKDCMSILKYDLQKGKKKKENNISENVDYAIEDVYEVYSKLRTASLKVSITDMLNGLGLKRSQKMDFMNFVDSHKDYFKCENNKIVHMCMNPEIIKGTNAYNEKILKEHPDEFIMYLHANCFSTSEQTYSIYMCKMQYDLFMINNKTFEKVYEVFKDDFTECISYTSKSYVPYCNNAYKKIESKNYRYDNQKISKNDLQKVIKEMKEKAKNSGMNLIFSINEYQINEYKND